MLIKQNPNNGINVLFLLVLTIPLLDLPTNHNGTTSVGAMNCTLKFTEFSYAPLDRKRNKDSPPVVASATSPEVTGLSSLPCKI